MLSQLQWLHSAGPLIFRERERDKKLAFLGGRLEAALSLLPVSVKACPFYASLCPAIRRQKNKETTRQHT